MDFFKILARSTTHSRGQQRQQQDQQQQQSSPLASHDTTKGNLFENGSVHTPNPRKRKRKGKIDTLKTRSDVNDRVKEQVVPPYLDYFENKNTTTLPSQSGSLGNAHTEHEDVIESDSDERVEEEEEAFAPTLNTSDLDEASIKSLLRKHKLKYTVLQSPSLDTQSSPINNKVKKSKSSKLKANSQLKSTLSIYPPPLVDFSLLRSRYALSKRLYTNLIAQGFVEPTEPQMGSLPLLLSHNDASGTGLGSGEDTDPNRRFDLIAVAPTGSGKTIAYALPLIDRLIAKRKGDRSMNGDTTSTDEKGIKAIIMAPTRELADQIVNEFRKLIAGTGVTVLGLKKTMFPKSARVKHSKNNGKSQMDIESTDSDGQSDNAIELSDDDSTSSGPVKASQQVNSIKSDILVSTPLLLLHFLDSSQHLLDTSFVQDLILDEADVLLDELFLDQTMSIVSHLVSPNLHYSFWSATMSSTSEALAKSIIVSKDAPSSLVKRNIVRLICGIKDTSLPTIQQKITYTASERGKLVALRQLFNSSLAIPCLIFVQTIARAQALHAEIIYDLHTPGRIATLHSNLSEHNREKIMDSFRNGEIWVLITTDLLSRGVDFRGVKLVINYDIPTSIVSYIHRIGRTGRAGRLNGQALTFYTKEDVPYVRGIVGVMEKSGGAEGLEQWMMESLPRTNKEDKKKLKKYGVRERQTRASDGNKVNTKFRISTKSGYERRKVDLRNRAIAFNKARKTANDEDSD